MKDPLKGFCIAVTGDFGKDKSPEKFKRWIEANGGQHVTKIDANTTHLICSKENWKKQSTMVQAAKHYPKKVKIVTYDWLEDSLMARSRKREGEYLIKKHDKADRKKKNAAKDKERSALKKEGTSKKKATFADSSLALLQKHEAEFKSRRYADKPAVEEYSNYYSPQTAENPTEGAGSEEINANKTDTSSGSESIPALSQSKTPIPESFKPPEPIAQPVIGNANAPPPEPANHHLYVDLEGYTYNITLVRIQVEQNTNERYILRLFQSNSSPYTYALYQRYSKFKALPEERILVPIGSSWEQCYAELKKVVKEYTEIEWELRGAETPASVRDRTKFVFVRPRIGGPRGVGQGFGQVVKGAVMG